MTIATFVQKRIHPFKRDNPLRIIVKRLSGDIWFEDIDFVLERDKNIHRCYLLDT